MKTLTNKITMKISTFHSKVMFSVTKRSHELERQSWLTFKTMIERTHNRLFRLQVTLFILFVTYMVRVSIYIPPWPQVSIYIPNLPCMCICHNKHQSAPLKYDIIIVYIYIYIIYIYILQL